MGVLERSGPDVHVAHLVVFSVEGEGFRFCPGLHYEVVRFVILLAQAGGGHAVGVVGVHRGADRESGDEPAAAYAVEHCELLRYTQGRVVEGEAIAENHYRGVLGAAGESRRGDIGGRHDPVCVVVVFVDADAVESNLVREFQLVQILVVELVRLDRIEQVAWHIHPDAAVLLLEVLGQIAVGH